MPILRQKSKELEIAIESSRLELAQLLSRPPDETPPAAVDVGDASAPAAPALDWRLDSKAHTTGGASGSPPRAAPRAAPPEEAASASALAAAHADVEVAHDEVEVARQRVEDEVARLLKRERASRPKASHP